MGKKLYIKTYGCQMNEYDSDKTVDILKEKKGVELTSNVKEADIILLNTCSIRDKAESKVYSELGRLNKLKEKNPNLKIGVGGCVATQEGSNIKKRAPYVDLIYGPQTLHRVSDLLDIDPQKGIKAIDIPCDWQGPASALRALGPPGSSRGGGPDGSQLQFLAHSMKVTMIMRGAELQNYRIPTHLQQYQVSTLYRHY